MSDTESIEVGTPDHFSVARVQTMQAQEAVAEELRSLRAERDRINDRIRLLVGQEETLRSAVRVLTRSRAMAEIAPEDQP